MKNAKLDTEKQPVKPIRKIIEKQDRTLRYVFCEKEIVELAKQLAEKNREAARLAEDKQRVTSDFKAKIDSCCSQISVTGNKIQSGYELREIKCEVHFDEPKIGKKRIVRLDLNEEVAVEDMTAMEMQRQFDFNQEEDGERNTDDKEMANIDA